VVVVVAVIWRIDCVPRGGSHVYCKRMEGGQLI